MTTRLKPFALLHVCVVALSLLLAAASEAQQAASPFGHYQESVTDMSVKILGGYVSVQRDWRGHLKRWVFFPNWQDLDFGPAEPGELPKAIKRGEVTFDLEAGTATPLWKRKLSGDRITFANDVYRWEDIDGNWIDFDSQGRMTTFGDRNITMATAVRDGQGRITGIRDHHDIQEVLTFEYTGANLTRAYDYTGRQVLYTYNGADLVTVTDVRGNPWGYTYSNGALSTKTDAEGRVTTISYNTDGTLKSVRDEHGFGADFRYSYDSSKRQYYTYVRRSGNVVTETWTDDDGEIVREDLNGRTILSVRRDGNDRIHTDENGNRTRVRYDALRRLVEVVYPDGATMSREVTIFDSPDAIVNENGVRTEFVHDGKGNVTRIIEAVDVLGQERVTELTYNALGQLTERREVVDGGSGDRVTTFEYDAFGNVSKTTDAEGNVTEREHDVLGNVTDRLDARGKTWLYTFDAAGRLLTTRDPLLSETSRVYDKVGNLTEMTDEEDGVTQYAYNGRNRVVEQTDALGKVWRFEYNDAGLLKRRVDPESHAVSYQHDRDGRITALVDGNGNVTTTAYFAGNTPQNSQPGRLERFTFPTFTRERQYDARNRLIAESDIDSTSSRLTTLHSYDKVGNRTSTTNPDGRVTTMTYDALNRSLGRTLTDNRVITTQRDAWDQLVRITDPRQQTTELRFDKLGGRISEKKPGGGITTFVYDETGHVTKIVDPRDQIVESDYDDAGRLAEERAFASSGAPTPSQVTTYSYNARGDLLGYGYGDDSHSAIHVVDALGRVESVTVDFGPFTKGHQYTYYDNGLVRTFTGPDDVTYEYGYDAGNQLRSIQISGEGQIVYSAYQWTVSTQILLPGGTVQEYEHDDFLRPTRVSSKDPAGNIILDHQYTWNSAGQLTDKITEDGTYHYEYDAVYQLTLAESSVLSTEAYAYDAAGNRLPADPNEQTAWQYNSDNELLSTSTATYTFDAAGNRVTETPTGPGEGRQFIYDERSQLVRVETASEDVIARYGYDAFRRRVWKEVGSEKTYFYYTDDGLVAELSESGDLVRSFAYKPRSPWTKAPLLQAAGGYSYYHNDHLGTPHRLTNAGGTAVWSSKYSAYGVSHLDFETTPNPLRFPGQYYDDETGLVQNWHRYYDAAVGRYLTPDPLVRRVPRAAASALSVYVGNDPNLYAYAGGDPIRNFDSVGLQSGTGSIVFDCLAMIPSLVDHVNRNQKNNCPCRKPVLEVPDCELRTWRSQARKIRAGDGSECRYDRNGTLLPDDGRNYTFNFGPDPYTIDHICKDVLPEVYYFGVDVTPGLTRIYNCNPCDPCIK